MPLPSILVFFAMRFFLELLGLDAPIGLFLLDLRGGRVRGGYIYAKHTLVVHENLGRETFDNPRVQKRLERSDTLFRVPFEALLDKVEEGLRLSSDYFEQRPSAGNAKVSCGVLTAVEGLV